MVPLCHPSLAYLTSLCTQDCPCSCGEEVQSSGDQAGQLRFYFYLVCGLIPVLWLVLHIAIKLAFYSH